MNKQYSVKEYEAVVTKIISHMKETGEWGQYFPPEYSVYGYNETTAQEYFPLKKEAATQRGWHWQDNMPGTYGRETKNWEDISDAIAETSEDICQEILACEETGKNYKIIQDEFNFYSAMQLPLPRLHPDVRHARRMAMRNPRHLWQRQCMCTRSGHGWHKTQQSCANTFATSFSPDRPEQVFCAQCYQAEVV